ncbi:MAG: multidrug effflux MFS transporter [Alphaproteobacteria bacterium]|nr:multidrug effflux MFS transporter [Alphaproteobacteria bacterium]
MQTLLQKPSLWLIIIIVVLPQLSETIYTPSLPDIAHTLRTSENMVEFTLTIYLLGFAVGILLWGNLSDRIGRRPTLLIGLLIYLLGCVGCWYSTNITMLMISRFIQAFGGGTGSVLGQAIARDSFTSHERGKVFSTVTMAISCAPALGPIIGGFTDQYFGWEAVFVVLFGLGCYVTSHVFLSLPETNTVLKKTNATDLIKGAGTVLTDKRVLSFGFLVGTANGIIFSLYSEAPFYLIEMLGITPSQYGMLYFIVGISFVIGAWLSRYLIVRGHSQELLLSIGNGVVFLGATLWAIFALLGYINIQYEIFSVLLTLGFIVIQSFGIALILPNALSHALENYSHMAGTAASLFGFYYYILVSLMTFGMGFFHNGTVIPMPLYFTGLSLSMCFVQYVGLRRSENQTAVNAV